MALPPPPPVALISLRQGDTVAAFTVAQVLKLVSKKPIPQALKAFKSKILALLGKNKFSKPIIATIPAGWFKASDDKGAEDIIDAVLTRVIKFARDGDLSSEASSSSGEESSGDESSSGSESESSASESSGSEEDSSASESDSEEKRKKKARGSGFKEPIPRTIAQPAFSNLAAYTLFADYIHGASVIPFDSFFKKGFKPPSPFIKVCFKLAQDGILWHALSTAMRQVVSPDTLRLKPEGTSFREPTSLPIAHHVTGGTPYAFLSFYTNNYETHPNLPSANSTYLAGLKRLGEALQDGMGRFAMTISSTFGPQASSAAVVYIWLSFYLRRSIPLLLDASDSPAVISLYSGVIAPLAQAAAISAQLEEAASKHAKGKGNGAGGGGGGGGGGGVGRSAGGSAAGEGGTIPNKLPPLLDKPDQPLSETNCGWHEFKDADKKKHGYAKCFLIPVKCGGAGKAEVPGPWWARPYLKDKKFPAVGQSWRDVNRG